MNRNFFGMNLNITMILVIINMVVFLLVHIIPGLINLLALQPALPWTVVTSMFTHWDIWHVFMNLLALFLIGSYIESILGAKRFLLTYFAGGIIGGMFFILWNVLLGTSGIAVGASGAIFGIITALAVLRPNQRIYLFPLPVPLKLPAAVIIAFFAAMFLIPHAANTAHLGGIVGGAICGYYFRKKSRPSYEYDEYGNIYRY